MTCRSEILDAVEAIVRRSGRAEFSPDDVIGEMRRRGTRYPDSTIRTHIVSAMCLNAPANHAYRTSELCRVDRGLYRRNRPEDDAAVSERAAPALRVPESASGPDLAASEVASCFEAYTSGRASDSRYASFDYCFNHFQGARESGRSGNLAHGPNLELSCLHLGFYLASWGMLRGSSDLLQRSVRALVPLVRLIATEPATSWEIDVGSYGDRLDDLVALCERVRSALPGSASDTLVTKAVLGVFGAVPAFDRYFRLGLGRTTYSRRSLSAVSAFYLRHRGQIDAFPKVATLDFGTGESTHRVYPVAKVVDMILFERGRQVEAIHAAGLPISRD